MRANTAVDCGWKGLTRPGLKDIDFARLGRFLSIAAEEPRVDGLFPDPASSGFLGEHENGNPEGRREPRGRPDIEIKHSVQERRFSNPVVIWFSLETLISSTRSIWPANQIGTHPSPGKTGS
jgi:hypothetical protein